MKHEAINSPVELVPFADLYVSPLNPRTVFSPEGIEALVFAIGSSDGLPGFAGAVLLEVSEARCFRHRCSIAMAAASACGSPCS